MVHPVLDVDRQAGPLNNADVQMMGINVRRPNGISVLMPVYRVELRWLKIACESTMASMRMAEEEGIPCEFVVSVDGCDQPDVLTYLKHLEGAGLIHTLVISEVNRGVASALNFGLAECKMDLVARFDADDCMKRARLVDQFKYLDRNFTVSVVGGGLNYMAENVDGHMAVDDNVVSHPEVIDLFLASRSPWFINHPTVMFRRADVVEVGGYDEALNGMAEDFDLWVRLLLAGKEIRNVAASNHLLRISDGSASRNFRPGTHEAIIKAQQRCINALVTPKTT